MNVEIEIGNVLIGIGTILIGIGTLRGKPETHQDEEDSK